MRGRNNFYKEEFFNSASGRKIVTSDVDGNYSNLDYAKTNIKAQSKEELSSEPDRTGIEEEIGQVGSATNSDLNDSNEISRPSSDIEPANLPATNVIIVEDDDIPQNQTNSNDNLSGGGSFGGGSFGGGSGVPEAEVRMKQDKSKRNMKIVIGVLIALILGYFVYKRFVKK